MDGRVARILTFTSQWTRGLGFDGLGHIAEERVDIFDTGHEGCDGVLCVQAGLAIFQLWDAVLAIVACGISNRAGGILVAVILGPGGGGVNGSRHDGQV